MSIKLAVGSESFNFPITGSINYGEGASDWAQAISSAVSEFFGPGDIRTTESSIQEGQAGNIAGLLFDTSYVQRIHIKGIITRTLTNNDTLVESFLIEGAYNGTQFNFSVQYEGDETEVEISATGGQFTYVAGTVTDTSTISIKYNASTIVDEDSI